MPEPFRIGTRGSRLALWQAHRVRDLLHAAHAGLEVEIVVLKTRGDIDREASLSAPGTIGFFTKEIEQALLQKQVDIAIHSLKDLPTEIVPGLRLAAVPEREDPRDVIVGRRGRVGSVADLGPGIRVGTSSPRRRGQLLAACPGIEIEPLRGNVPTRIAKVEEEGGPDAVVLALAGLKRLGLEGVVTEVLPLDLMLPAAAQGALGIETRAGDRRAAELVAPLDDPACRVAVEAERAFLSRLQGGCSVPAGVLAEPGSDGSLRLRGAVADPDGGESYRDAEVGDPEDPQILGRLLAEKLLGSGAAKILARLGKEAP